MSRGSKFFMLALIGSLGAWGCAQGPTNGAASAERVRALEAKLNKLEDDFKAAISVREQLKKKVNTLEEERGQLAKRVEQLQSVVRERDDLRQQLTARTTERDTAIGQFDNFRRGIKTLLTQMEQGGAPTQSATSAAEPIPPPKS